MVGEQPCAEVRRAYWAAMTLTDDYGWQITNVHADGFEVWLIPHTVAVTNLCQRKAGDAVNLEFDILAKYVERLVATKA